jgi:AraC-like DNA-binding protein
VDAILADIVDGLLRHSDDEPAGAATLIDRRAVERARHYLAAHLSRVVASEELEAVTGLDRFALARQFRRAFGTSPHRYWLMRRLHRARLGIEAGETLVDVALASGFADQSHLTRHFKKTYGIPPGRWASLVATGRGSAMPQAANRLST